MESTTNFSFLSADMQNLLHLLSTEFAISEQATIELALRELAESRHLAIGATQPTTASRLPDPPAADSDATTDAVAGSE